MQQNTQPPQSGCHLVAPKPDFKIFVACENQSALGQARRVRDQIEFLCGEDFEVSSVFWSFALFRNEQLRARAVLEAAAAEVIVISLGGGDELPAHAQAWVEDWPTRPRAGQAVLVALVGAEHERGMHCRRQMAYLKEMAASRGLDFLCNHGDRGRTEIFAAAASVLERAESGRGSISPVETAWSTGGINE